MPSTGIKIQNMTFKQLQSSKNFQNSLWNIVEVLLGPFILFITIPIFLELLGKQDYGIWMLVNTIIIVMQSLNLGLNFSTYKHVSAAIPKMDKQQISETLNTNLSLTIIISIFSLLICCLLALGIYHFEWFIDNPQIKEKLIICIFVGVAILYYKLSEQILYNVYRAFENFKYVTILTSLIKIVILSGNLLIAYFTKNIIWVLCFSASIGIIGLFINYLILHRFIPFYKFTFKLSKASIKYEISYSLFVWLQSIMVIIAYQGDRLLVSYGFGVTILSYYAIIATLFNHIHMAFAAITAWLFPQIAKNKDDNQLILDLYQNARNVSAVISIVCLSVFSILSKVIFSFWLGSENYGEIREYLKWFTIFEFFFIFTIIPNFFLNASKYERFNLKMTAMYTGLNITGMLAAYILFKDIQSILIGLTVTTILGMYIYHLQMDNKFYQSKYSFIKILLLLTPSFFGSGTAFFEDYSYKFISFILCILSIYIIFIKYDKTKFKLLIS